MRTETCSTIVSLHHQAPGKIIIPTFKGKRGHPSLFPIKVIGDIFFKNSLRDIVREDNSRVLLVEVPDEGVVLDMDTEIDYQAMVDRYDASRP